MNDSNSNRLEQFKRFNADTIARTGSFELDMTPENALPLITAPGEKLWISTWDPVMLNGDGFNKGTVFVTSNHGHISYWHVMDYDTEAHHALYVRVTPEADTGTVDVSIQSNGKGGSTVNVSYQLTALSAAGNENLAASFSEPKYSQMMEDWKTMIESNREKIDKHFSRRGRPRNINHGGSNEALNDSCRCGCSPGLR